MNPPNRSPIRLPDLGALILVVLLVFVFLLPILTLRHGIFIDDVPTFSFPNAVFSARALQAGEFPLWDPHTWAGGSPFVTRLDALPYYLPLWIFGRLGRIAPPAAAYFDLMLLPIVLSYLWAAAGAFLLGRAGIGLSRPGAFALAAAYALSSSMLAGMLNPPMVLSLAWHPWFALAAARTVRSPRPAAVAGWAILVAVGLASWPNYAVQGLLLAALFAAGAVMETLRRKGKGPAGKGLAAAAAAFALALLLSAPYWWAVAIGGAYVSETMPLGYDFLTAGPRSLPPRWLATIFVPELFGSTNFSVGWGVARSGQMHWCEAFLTRGLLSWFPAFLAAWTGILALFRRRGRPAGGGGGDPRGFWSRLALLLLLLSVLLMLGRHTPVFRWLSALCPLFRIPYATRWHTIFTMAFALLSGIGVDRLLAPEPAPFPATRGRLAAYLLLAGAATAAALALPLGYWRGIGDWGWFLSRPVLYGALSAFLLGLLALARRRFAGRGGALLFLSSLLLSAAWDAYRPMGVTWAPEQEASRSPADNDLYRFLHYAAGLSLDRGSRVGYSRVFAPVRALVHGGDSFLGVGVKPMPPLVFQTLAEVCAGMPNETTLRDPAIPFVRNMSTGFWWYDRRDPPAPGWEPVAGAEGFGLFLFRLPDPLPRVFTLDRLEPASFAEGRKALLYRDLHEAVIIDAADPAALARASPRPLPPGVSPSEHFAAVNALNRIVRADFPRLRRAEIEVEIAVPAMLVLTDVWHPDWRATDNGRPTMIHRVNHLQRGVWLEEGRHRVEMEFRPASVFTGRWLTLSGLIACALLPLLSLRGRKRA